MSDTAADTDEFTDLVAGIVPETHLVCLTCHPDGVEPGTEALCGVKLLGEEPLPGSSWCRECREAWGEHFLEHWGME